MENLGDILRRVTARNISTTTNGDGAALLREVPTNGPAEEACAVCNGVGWVSKRVPVGHLDFGRTFPCDCQETKNPASRTDALRRYSNLGPLSRITFQNTRQDGPLPDAASSQMFRAGLDAAVKFAERPAGWLVFTGPSGSGKTHLAVAVANHCIEHGETTFFIAVADLLDHLRATYSPDNPVSYDELFDQVRNVPVLVLDDLGGNSTTPWAEEKLFQVINHRFNLSLPTVITVRSPLHNVNEHILTRIESLEGASQVHQLGHFKTNPLGKSQSSDLGPLSNLTFVNTRSDGPLLDSASNQMFRAGLDAAMKFAERPSGWLVFTGPSGSGKTHLAVAIANRFIEHGEHTVFIAVADLLDHLRAAYSPDNSVSYDELFEQVRNVPMLVLDDLGGNSTTPWAEEKLFQIMNHRFNLSLPTVITVRGPLHNLNEHLRTRIESSDRLSQVHQLGHFKTNPLGKSRSSDLGPLSNLTFVNTRSDGPLPDAASSQMFRSGFNAATKFAERPSGWLVFTGPSGSGKTHLAVAIANRCIEHGETTFFIAVADLLDHLRAAYSPDNPVSYDELFEQIRNVPVLVLDDLGGDDTNAWAEEKLLQIINHRFNLSLPTVITVRGSLHRLNEHLRTRMESSNSFSQVHQLGQFNTRLTRRIGDLPADMQHRMTFAAFDTRGGRGANRGDRESLEKAKAAAQDFVFDPAGWILFTGPHGSGKTHLALAIASECLRRGHSVFYAFVPTLLDHLRGTFSPESPMGYDELFEQIITVPLLILDDLGAEHSTPWAEEKLYQVVVHRHEARLPTVITSVSNIDELEDSRPRIGSRLMDGSFVDWQPITAPNYRDQNRTRQLRPFD